MFNYKDFANEEDLTPDNIPLLRNANGTIRAIDTAQAEERFKKHNLIYGPGSAEELQKVQKLVVGLGITTDPGEDTIPIGVGSNGQQLYSKKQFAQSKDTEAGKKLNETTFTNFAPTKMFNDDEATRFQQIGNHAADPELMTRLNNSKTNGDTYGFRNSIKRAVGGSDFAAAELFDNWHNLSEGQKSLALAGIGNQGFKFDDGSTLATKKITPDVNAVRGMTPKDVAALNRAGTNPYPVVKHWDEMVMLQERQFNPRSAVSLSANAKNLNLLGYGEEGSAVQIAKTDLEALDAQAEPHIGVGAISIPADRTPPPDYVRIGSANGRTQIIPKAHVNTAITGTDTSRTNAQSMYAKWGAPKEKDAAQGVVGGNQMLAGTMALTDSNPHAVSSAVATRTAPYTRESTTRAEEGTLEEIAAGAKTVGKGVSLASKVNSLISGGAAAGNAGIGGTAGAANSVTAGSLSQGVATGMTGEAITTTGQTVSAAGAEAGIATTTAAENAAVTAGGAQSTGSAASTAAAGLGYLAAAYGAYTLVDMALNGGDVYKSDTGMNTVKGATAGAAVGSAVLPGVGTAIGAVVGGAFGLAQGLSGSGKGQRQRIRDSYREAIIDNGSPLMDANYQGTLADGTAFDFGKDKYSFDSGKGNVDGNIDLSTDIGAKAASYGNVLAAMQGVTDGKARESLAAMFAQGALANAGDDESKMVDNMRHFMGQLGVKDGSQVQAVLNKLRVEDSLGDDDYRAFSNAASEVSPPSKDDKVRQLTPKEIDEINGKVSPEEEKKQSDKVVMRSAQGQKVMAFDGMVQHAANVVVNGDPSKVVELDYEAKDITDANYKDQFQKIRASYAQKGISSKQVGLHLINQAYAEKRISELEYTSAYMSLHAVFDNDKALYDKMTTGASAGRRQYKKRQGA